MKQGVKATITRLFKKNKIILFDQILFVVNDVMDCDLCDCILREGTKRTSLRREGSLYV